MDGVPVYLASVARKDRLTGRTVPNEQWSAAERAHAVGVLRQVLEGVGDPARERLFRMQITFCVHRAATDAEVAALPDWFGAAEPIDIAGGPLEILQETVVGRPSTRPCVAPSKRHIDARDPNLWLPRDCGVCPPCLARAAI